MPINSSLGVQAETINNIQFITLQKRMRKYRGSIYDISMVILCPNYTHKIQNVSSGRIFREAACIQKDI